MLPLLKDILTFEAALIGLTIRYKRFLARSPVSRKYDRVSVESDNLNKSILSFEKGLVTNYYYLTDSVTILI